MIAAVNPTTVNTAVLKAVQAKLLAQPERFNMDHWCGSVCCVAGHVLEASGISTDGLDEWAANDIIQLAAMALDVSAGTAIQLFYIDHWPDVLRERYMDAMDASAYNRAAVAGADAIDWFLGELVP